MKPLKNESFLVRNKTTLLWALAGALSLGLLMVRIFFPEPIYATIAVSVLLVATLGMLALRYRTELTSRGAAYGFNSTITVLLVTAILGVGNFLATRYPKKIDLTEKKLHTLSDQSEKLIKGLQKEVVFTFFGKMQQKEKSRALLENLQNFNPEKLKIEYVDPDKEPTRAKQLGIREYGTLHIGVGERSQKVEDPNEEKVTNALIKLIKDKKQTLCTITGHGERGIKSQAADGFDVARKSLEDQAYEIKEITLPQVTEIPADCDAIAVLGPTKALFANETKLIADYLDKGGRALITLEGNVQGQEPSPELVSLLESWHVKAQRALIVDPLSRMLNVDASVPILATYNTDQAITKGFETNCYFPFSRPLEIVKGAPAGLKVDWLAKTTPKSWGETDFASLGKGSVSQGQNDVAGPLTVGIAVDGKKDPKATRNTRIVVYGSTLFGSNNFSRYGGNLDLFLNSVSWTLEDESLISIRAKEDDNTTLELSQQVGTLVFWLTVILLPLGIAIAGIVIWAIRRRR